MKWGKAALAGCLGALMMTGIGLLLRSAGVLSVNPEHFIGSLLTGSWSVETWWLGLLLHLTIGSAFGLAYGAIMTGLRMSGWLTGLMISCYHAVFSGLVVSAVGSVHPLVRAGDLPAPEAFGSGLGPAETLAFIGVHLAFGLFVGSFYETAADTAPAPSPEPHHRSPSTVLYR